MAGACLHFCLMDALRLLLSQVRQNHVSALNLNKWFISILERVCIFNLFIKNQKPKKQIPKQVASLICFLLQANNLLFFGLVLDQMNLLHSSSHPGGYYATSRSRLKHDASETQSTTSDLNVSSCAERDFRKMYFCWLHSCLFFPSKAPQCQRS